MILQIVRLTWVEKNKQGCYSTNNSNSVRHRWNFYSNNEWQCEPYKGLEDPPEPSIPLRHCRWHPSYCKIKALNWAPENKTRWCQDESKYLLTCSVTKPNNNNQIHNFGVTFHLCFKVSPSAKPFIWKLVFFHTQICWFIYMWIKVISIWKPLYWDFQTEVKNNLKINYWLACAASELNPGINTNTQQNKTLFRIKVRFSNALLVSQKNTNTNNYRVLVRMRRRLLLTDLSWMCKWNEVIWQYWSEACLILSGTKILTLILPTLHKENQRRMLREFLV